MRSCGLIPCGSKVMVGFIAQNEFISHQIFQNQSFGIRIMFYQLFSKTVYFHFSFIVLSNGAFINRSIKNSGSLSSPLNLVNKTILE